MIIIYIYIHCEIAYHHLINAQADPKQELVSPANSPEFHNFYIISYDVEYIFGQFRSVIQILSLPSC